MTDAAIIYRTHVEAIESLPEAEQLKAYKAIIAYCMDDVTPDDMIGRYTVGMAKPLLDKWKAKRIAGAKGGSTTEANANNSKQTEANGSKSEQTEATVKKAQPKVKEKVKEKDNKDKLTYGEYKNVRMSAEEYEKLCAEYGEQKTAAAIKILDEYIAEKGYKSKSHYLSMRRWVMNAVGEKKTNPPNRKAPGTKFSNFPEREDQQHKDMVAKLISMQ